jgi:hypothetical protein
MICVSGLDSADIEDNGKLSRKTSGYNYPKGWQVTYDFGPENKVTYVKDTRFCLSK